MPIGEVHLSEEGWEEARLEAENNTLKGALYTYYLDEDEDGYGGASFEEVEKGMNTTGYISRGGDCNDVIGSGEAINPGAVEDYSNDGDEDCDGRVEVNDCRTLGAEGVTYYLDGDVSAGGDCFIISANDVTFDLGGYTLTGVGIGFGISNGNYGVIVKNGEISGFAMGIFSGGWTYLNVEYMSIFGNGNNVGYGNGGIFAEEGGGTLVIDNSNISNNNADGVWASQLFEVIISQTTIKNNARGLYCQLTNRFSLSDSNLIKGSGIDFWYVDRCDITSTNVNYCGADISCPLTLTLTDGGGNTCSPTGPFTCGGGAINCGACS
jgi:hypothetical protein